MVCATAVFMHELQLQETSTALCRLEMHHQPAVTFCWYLPAHMHTTILLLICCPVAILQVCSPALAAPMNPVSELAGLPNPITKTLKKLDSMDPLKGVKGPEVEGQFRECH